MLPLSLVPAPSAKVASRSRWFEGLRAASIQHTTALVALPVLVLIAIVVLFVTGQGPHQALGAYQHAGCSHAGTQPRSTCLTSLNSLHEDAAALTGVLVMLRGFVVAIGMFIGAPLLARELESGTFRFAWTQSAGRGRWLIAKLGILTALTVLCSFALAAVAAWWVEPFNHVGLTNRWQAGQFDVTRLTLPAWTLFALAMGVTLGVVTRRALTAMALSSATMMGILTASFWRFDQFLLSLGASSERVPLRGHLEVLLGPLNYAAPPSRAWVPTSNRWLVSGWLTRFGHRLSPTEAESALSHALQAEAAGFRKNGADAWLREHHYTYGVTFQPASHYAIVQGILAGTLVTMALLLVGFTIQRVRLAHVAPGSRRSNDQRAPVPLRATKHLPTASTDRATFRQRPQGSDSG